MLSSLVATLLTQKAHIVLLQETLLTIATCYCNLRNKTFLECFEFLKEHFICGLCNEGSLVFRKPTIGISYTNHFSRISYKYFNKISCKYVYEENNYISLNEIMEDFPAERCIEYLKDHGIAACPILNK